jgi:hypothetical protein
VPSYLIGIPESQSGEVVNIFYAVSGCYIFSGEAGQTQPPVLAISDIISQSMIQIESIDEEDGSAHYEKRSKKENPASPEAGASRIYLLG